MRKAQLMGTNIINRFFSFVLWKALSIPPIFGVYSLFPSLIHFITFYPFYFSIDPVNPLSISLNHCEFKRVEHFVVLLISSFGFVILRFFMEMNDRHQFRTLSNKTILCLTLDLLRKTLQSIITIFFINFQLL